MAILPFLAVVANPAVINDGPIAEVSAGIRNDPTLVVEHFLPDPDEAGYAMRK